MFVNDASMETFVASPILREISGHPDVRDLTYRKYNAAPDLTKN